MDSTGYRYRMHLDSSKESTVPRYSRHCTTRAVTGLSCTLMDYDMIIVGGGIVGRT